MLDGSVNTGVIKRRHSSWLEKWEKVKEQIFVVMCAHDFKFIQVCMWSSEKPSVCVYVFLCVYAWTRLVISDKGHGEWQGGQPAGVCQCRVNSGLSDRDFSWHSVHSCSWKSNYKLAGCSDTMKTVAAIWPPSLMWSYYDWRPVVNMVNGLFPDMSDTWNIVHSG